jgi:hypothetical protein
MTHAFSAVFFRRLSRERHRSISFKVAWPVMAAISCGTIFLVHSQNALPLPSSSGGAAGMVRCLAGNLGCPEDASFRAFGRLKRMFEFQSIV